MKRTHAHEPEKQPISRNKGDARYHGNTLHLCCGYVCGGELWSESITSSRSRFFKEPRAASLRTKYQLSQLGSTIWFTQLADCPIEGRGRNKRLSFSINRLPQNFNATPFVTFPLHRRQHEIQTTWFFPIIIHYKNKYYIYSWYIKYDYGCRSFCNLRRNENFSTTFLRIVYKVSEQHLHLSNRKAIECNFY